MKKTLIALLLTLTLLFTCSSLALADTAPPARCIRSRYGKHRVPCHDRRLFGEEN